MSNIANIEPHAPQPSLVTAAGDPLPINPLNVDCVYIRACAPVSQRGMSTVHFQLLACFRVRKRSCACAVG